MAKSPMILLFILPSCMLQEKPQSLYNRLSPACVEILVDGRLTGSGWLADPAGFVVTAAHFLWNVEGKVEVRMSEGSPLAAKVQAFDLGHDLALVQLPARDRPYPALEVAPEAPAAGAGVFLYGSPQFRHRLLLAGRVARAEPAFEYLPDLKCAARVVHVAGPGVSGTSGGCWVDREGRVVLNQSGGIRIEGHFTGISFAAPADAIRRLVTTRASAGTADAGIVIEELMEHSPEVLKGLPRDKGGVLAVICPEGGPARLAGLAPKFLIATVDGRPMETRDGFYTAIRSRKPGEAVRLGVFRKGATEPETVEIRLAALEAPVLREGSK